MNIGLWVPHTSVLCRGQFNTPSIVTRMSYNFSEQGGPRLDPICYSGISIANTALGSFQNAQYLGNFLPGFSGLKLYLTLYIGGTYSFYPTVQVNGITYLTTAGTAVVTLPFTTCSLNFSISPVAPGSLPSGAMQLTGYIAT